MGSSRTKHRAVTEDRPSKASLSKAREVVQNWEHAHTNNEELVIYVARALDDSQPQAAADVVLARKLIEAVEVLGGSHLPAYNRAIDDAAKVMRDTCKKLGVDVGGTS